MPRTPPLAKLLAYLLGRRPDEFGLVPDPQGFVPLRTLLQVLAEEEGWGHVRRGHLNEIALLGAGAPVEIVGEAIRAVDRSRLARITSPDALPKLLFTCIRRRAYAHVLARGIEAPPPPGVVLAADGAMALRMGRRRDCEPILLHVRTRDLEAAGARLERFGETLYLASALPCGAFHGPPPPKEKTAAQTEPAPQAPRHPGSFFPDLAPVPAASKTDRRREPEWKRHRRLDRRRRGGVPTDRQ